MAHESTPEISVFLAAIEKGNDQELAAYLDEACGDDRLLRRRVEALVAAHRGDNSFLERPAPGLEQVRDANLDAMNAGLAATFGPESALVIGSAGHSVLKSLGKKLTEVPNITLHDSHGDREAIVQPRSPELRGKADDSRYQLLGEIARGGMGAIIKGRDTDLGRDIAIKVLLASHKDKPELIQRFVEEAQIGGQLQHPGIVPVYELGQFGDERPFFSMKLVKGKTFAELLSQRKEPSEDVPKLLGIFEQVCQTMAYAHSKGVIHRDLKPANIMVGAFGEVQVMDWGLSKVLRQGGVVDEQRSLDKHRNVSVIQTRRSVGSDVPGEEVGSNTQMGSAMGTPAYMPPEQALGELDRLDARADVFGLGAILTEILTGKPPYVGESSTDTFRMASRGKLEDCHTRLDTSGADPQLIALTKIALSPEPEDRPSNAGDLAEGITKYLEGVQAKLKATEIAKERQSKKYYAATATMMFIIASTAAIGAVWFQRLATAKSALAQTKTELADARQKQLQSETESRKTAESTAKIVEEIFRIDSQPKNQPSYRARLALGVAESAKLIPGMLPRAHETLLKESFSIGSFAVLDHQRHRYAAISDNHHWIATTNGLWKFDGENPPKLFRSFDYDSGVVSFSPNNRWFVNGDGMLYDLEADDIVASVRQLKGPDGAEASIYTHTAVFSPNSQWLLTNSSEKDSLRLWNLSGEAPTTSSRVLVVHPEFWGQFPCSFSSDGRLLATRSADGMACLLDLTNPSSPPTDLREGGKRVWGMAFTVDGHWLITQGEEGIWKWDLTTGKIATSVPQALGVPSDHTSKVGSLSVSADSRWLAIGRRNGIVQLWDLTADASTSPMLLLGHEGLVKQLVFSPDNHWVFSGSHDNTIRRWDLTATSPGMNPAVLHGHDSQIRALSISGDGKWLVSATESEESIRVWDLGSEHPGVSPFILRGHAARINAVAISPDGRWAATASGDHTARIWDMHSRAPGNTSILLDAQNAAIEQLLFSGDGRLIAACDDGTARIWSWDSPAEHSTSSIVLRGHEHLISSMAIAAQAEVLATGDAKGRICVWNLNANDPSLPVHVLNAFEGTSANNLAFNSDGSRLAARGNETAFVFNLANKNPLESPTVFKHDDGLIFGVVMPPNLPLVVARTGTSLWLWKYNGTLADPQTIPIKQKGKGGNSAADPLMAVSPSGRWLVGADEGTVVKRWDLTAMDPTISVDLWEHSDLVDNVAFSADGRYVVSLGRDGTARVGQVELGVDANPLILRGTSAVTSAAISPDSRWVLTGSADGTARLWDLDVDRLIERTYTLVGGKPDSEEQE